jgi:LEA14-like dessication related protein
MRGVANIVTCRGLEEGSRRQAERPDHRPPVRGWTLTARRGAAAAALALLSTGCFASFRQPEVRLDALRLAAVDLRGGRLYGQLQVVNPNSYRLEAASISYDLEFGSGSVDGGSGWVRLAQGELTETLAVPARDSILVEVPIDFTFAGVSGVAQAILERGTVNYRVSGRVAVRRPVRREVPYRRTGSISLGGVG